MQYGNLVVSLWTNIPAAQRGGRENPGKPVIVFSTGNMELAECEAALNDWIRSNPHISRSMLRAQFKVPPKELMIPAAN